LLVEDNVTNQQVAVGILGKFGLNVEVVSNGKEALEAMERVRYDLVFMDVQMPEMDGLEATRRIRKRESSSAPANSGPSSGTGVPIVAMTAHALARDREQCLEAGMNDYLSKPLEPEALVRVLEKWLPETSSNPSVGAADHCQSRSSETIAASETQGAPIYDRATFLSHVMHDETLLLRVQGIFLKEMPGHIDALKDLVERGEIELAGMQAHKIKGAAASVCGEALRRAAEAMEQAGQAGDRLTLEIRLPDLQLQFLRLKAAMESQQAS
jgi:CheY-like chemotaxis protein/HPt (histidine-containing phosphotransfer) domain-containing protein